VLGERIKQSRIDRNIKQFELAEKLCVSQSTVAGWESGARKPDVEMVSRIAVLLGITTDYLLGNSDNSSTGGSDNLRDDDIKFAVFGDPDVTDEQFEEIKKIARIIRERDKK